MPKRFHLWMDTMLLSLSRTLLLAVALVACNTASSNLLPAQETRQLEHSDYDLWNTLGGSGISNDGKWILFSITSAKEESEPTLHVRRNGTNHEYTIERAIQAQFTFDSRHLVYRVPPPRARIEELKKAKVASDELPGTRLEILDLETGERLVADRVSSFRLPEKNGQWLAYLLEPPADDKALETAKTEVDESFRVGQGQLSKVVPPLKLKPRRPEPDRMPEIRRAEANGKPEPGKAASQEPAQTADAKPKTEPKKKSLGRNLVLVDLQSGIRQTYPRVVQFAFDEQGTRLALATSEIADSSKVKPPAAPATAGAEKAPAGPSATEPNDSVSVIELKTGQRQEICSGMGEYKELTFSKDGAHLAFLSNRDDYLTHTPSWSVFAWSARQKSALSVAQEKTPGLPEGWWISPAANLAYAEDGSRLYFDTAPVPEGVLEERKRVAAGKPATSSEKEPEKAKLDLWHWQDPLLQPEQLLQAEMERRRSYRAAYQLKSGKVIQLATLAIPSVQIDTRSRSPWAVATTNRPYRKMRSWDVTGFEDTYLINLNTGQPRLLLEKSRAGGRLSPEGKFVVWYDPEQRHWFSVPAAAQAEPVKISEGIPHPLFDERHDTPSLPPSYGTAGWLLGDAGLLVYDRYDLWLLDPTGKSEPICVTSQYGRQNHQQLRAQRLDREQRAWDPKQPIYLSTFDEQTKASGFCRLQIQTAVAPQTSADAPPVEPVTPLILLNEELGRLTKAQDTDDVYFTRSTFRQFPDLWSSTLDFKKVHRISEANPQQANYSWGTAELTRWKARDGQALEGLLYKPDGFDPARKYPLMVYFYERNSDNLHRYYAPAAGRSIINFSFYVSRGYVVFVPDIPYATGEPGPSAANAVLPGVEHVVAQGYIDPQRIGMQGHSWGGYQTAYLVTQTDMFACAESGAPVSNMTSAYGGIRWASGMSRMFQYEQTQSRIGDDLWSARDKYLANSPLFFADKINTPLLILHNDEDGAVPWYQGIELFVALRRLEKPAWLLNYNGEPHWVMKSANRMDFAKRMQQFFDHYLLEAPEPEWMAYGLPAVDKGKEFGLDLLEPAAPQKEPAAGDVPR